MENGTASPCFVILNVFRFRICSVLLVIPNRFVRNLLFLCRI
jgi:hypothetical protein